MGMKVLLLNIMGPTYSTFLFNPPSGLSQPVAGLLSDSAAAAVAVVAAFVSEELEALTTDVEVSSEAKALFSDSAKLTDISPVV